MAPLPLCIVCGAGYVSGKEIMAFELGRGMRLRGHDVRFLTSDWNNGEFPARLRSAGMAFHSLPLGFISATLTWSCIRMTSAQLLRWPALVIGYRCFLRRERPVRVVHTNWHHLLLLAPFLRRDRDLFWVHECVPDKPHYGLLFRWLAGRLGGFVCVSHAVAASLRKLGVPDPAIRVIYNGIADPAAPTGIGTGSADGIPKPFRIGIVGQVGAWKGHEDLLDALGRLRQSVKHAEVHVFGAGAEEHVESLKRRSAALGISDAVVWRGFVADRETIYRHLEVCAVVSRSDDPLPTTAIEAQFFALPIIATRRGGLPEIVEHEATGLLVDAGAPAQIAEALERLARDPNLRRTLGAGARTNALKRFSAGRFMEEFSAALEPGGLNVGTRTA